jgi:ribose transport system permease protein
MEFVAIAGAVIAGTPLHGGRARPVGTATGVLILAVVAAALNMLLVPFAWALLLQAAVILTAVALQRGRGD